MYLIANVDFHPRLEVVKDLFKVPCPGSSQVTGITVRLERRKQGEQKRGREDRERKREEVSMSGQTLATCLSASNYQTVTIMRTGEQKHIQMPKFYCTR